MEENFSSQNTPSAPVQPGPKKSVRIGFLICLLLAVIIFAGWFFWSSSQSVNISANTNAPKTGNTANNFKLPTSTPVTNFKNYTGNALSSQFPSDFPNPSKSGNVLNNFSMVLQEQIPVQMSTFKFTTTNTAQNLVKLYLDYFTKGGWKVNTQLITNGFSISGTKDKNFAGVIVIRAAAATTTIVTLQISSPL